MISQVLIDDFYKYFYGNNKAYGQFTITGKPNDKGKIPGKAQTINKAIKKANYIDHLNGKVSLGIIPINYDNQCRFGVIDIDDYNLDFNKLRLDIIKLNLPLVIIRSKSGGAHLYLFLEGFTSASFVVETLELFAALLGYEGVEIFPKQKELKQGAIGNWINLPLFGGDKTERYVIDYNGNRLDLYESLKLIKSNSKDTSEIKSFVESLPFKDGPPCLQKIQLRGVSTGNRNIFLFNLAIYLKQKYPDEWENKLVNINRANKEPLSFDELNRSIINSVKKKEYFYQCSQDPLKGLCNKPLCRLREFGIDNASIPSEIIGGLKKIIFHNDEIAWELEVNGHYLRFSTTSEVMKHSVYQERCMEQLNIWPRPVKPTAWRKIITDRLATVIEEQGPQELSRFGQFKEILKSFLKTTTVAVTREQMLSNNRIYMDSETKLVYFRGVDLVAYVNAKREYWLTRSLVWRYLREVNAVSSQFKVSYNTNGENKIARVKVWRINYKEEELYREIDTNTPIDLKEAKEMEDNNEPF